jgi:hypothetical protein
MNRDTRPNDKDQSVRQVQLPSGKVIEVVYFADRHSPQNSVRHPHGETPSRRQSERERDLHVCQECAGELVYPINWAEADSSHWEILLRCPDCEWTYTGVYPQTAVEQFDAELDRGGEALLRDLQHLVHANMAEEIERFVHALDNDHILPADF